MQIERFNLYPYTLAMHNNGVRHGVQINVIDKNGNCTWGDIAPLPKWSGESLEEACRCLREKESQIVAINWTVQNCFQELKNLNLLPSALFGLESAILSQVAPLPKVIVYSCALLMGSSTEILAQAQLRLSQGFTCAKLKVGHLDCSEALVLIEKLKSKFRLRIDVNRAWSTKNALRFFSQFPTDTFDYVEEPFANPYDLAQFTHPLAVDESFPADLSLAELAQLPTLKALIYKPTIQGGMTNCLPLLQWAHHKDISLILSSSFESDLGLAHIATMAQRLGIVEHLGIGTYHFLKEYLCDNSLCLSKASISFKSPIIPRQV